MVRLHEETNPAQKERRWVAGQSSEGRKKENGAIFGGTEGALGWERGDSLSPTLWEAASPIRVRSAGRAVADHDFSGLLLLRGEPSLQSLKRGGSTEVRVSASLSPRGDQREGGAPQPRHHTCPPRAGSRNAEGAGPLLTGSTGALEAVPNRGHQNRPGCVSDPLSQKHKRPESPNCPFAGHSPGLLRQIPVLRNHCCVSICNSAPRSSPGRRGGSLSGRARGECAGLSARLLNYPTVVPGDYS